MSRDTIRAAALGESKQRSEIVRWRDVEIEVRQPTVGQRSAILKAGGDRESPDMGRMLAVATVRCSFVPGSGERVFDDADVDALLDQPCGGSADELGSAVLRLLNVSPEDARKN